MGEARTRWRGALVALVALGLTAVAARAEPVVVKTSRVAELARSTAEQRGVPGLVVGVVTREGLIYSHGVGSRPPTAETLFRAGSVSKVIAGLALLQLRDAGRLNLDDPVARLLPEIDEMRPLPGAPALTIRHLITHRSGLPRFNPADALAHRGEGITEAAQLEVLRGLPWRFAPGSREGYSNLGMALAGIMVARAGGTPSFATYARTRVLAPLGMQSSTFDPAGVARPRLAVGYTRVTGGVYRPVREHPRMGAASAFTGLYTSTRDLAALVAAHLRAWDEPEPRRRVPGLGGLTYGSLRETMQPPEASSGGAPSPLGATTMPRRRGLVWRVNPVDPQLGYVVSHSGLVPGYCVQVVMLPARGMAVVAMMTSGFGSGDWSHLEALTRRILVELATRSAS